MGSIFKALIFTLRSKDSLSVYNPGFLVINNHGIIEAVEKNKQILKRYKEYIYHDYSNYLICPGFIDLHNHLPQYVFVGIGEKELLPWLKKYTFPRERLFADNQIAQESAQIFFNDLIKNGTTTTVTYTTIHKKATDIAFQCALESGIRAIIGKVLMDQNAPWYLKEDLDQSIKDSEELIEKWHEKDGKLFYCVTPRFAVSCSDDLLKRAGRLAQAKNTYIQTHLSENKGEIDFVRKLFPKAKNYTDVYYQTGILGQKSIMAHCLHLKQHEISLIKSTRSKIAHCPTSNRFLLSGIMPFRKYQTENLEMGLGTDVAGGYSLSMLSEMREAIENSKQFSLFSKEKGLQPMTLEEAFYLATLGGAKALSLDDQIGSLEAGKKADFLVIDYKKTDPFHGRSSYIKPLEILSRLIYRGNEAVIKEVYIEGNRVYKSKIKN